MAKHKLVPKGPPLDPLTPAAALFARPANRAVAQGMPRIAVGVGGSDHNTGLSGPTNTRGAGLLTTCDKFLIRQRRDERGFNCSARGRLSGLQYRDDALAAGRADGDQRPDRAGPLLLRLLHRELFGSLRQNPAASGRKGVTGSQRRPVDVELGSVDRSQRGVQTQPPLAVLLGLPRLQM